MEERTRIQWLDVLASNDCLRPSLSCDGRFALFQNDFGFMTNQLELLDLKTLSLQQFQANDRISAATMRCCYSGGDGKDQKLKKDHQLLYAPRGKGGLIKRWHLGSGEQAPLEDFSVEYVRHIVASNDGRYVAAAGPRAWNTPEYIQIWNLDQPDKPFSIFDCTPAAKGSVVSMSFNRSNTELYVSLDSGAFLVLRPLAREILSLHWELKTWLCHSIACNPETKGIAVGGQGHRVWFIDLPYKVEGECTVEDLPFRMNKGFSTTGQPHCYLPALPHSTLSCLETNVGSYVDKLQFLGKSELLVVGNRAVAIYDLSTSEVKEASFLPPGQKAVATGYDGNHATLLLARTEI